MTLFNPSKHPTSLRDCGMRNACSICVTASVISARAHVKRIGVSFGNKSCLLGSIGSQHGDRDEQSSVLLVFVSFVKRCPSPRQQSVQLNKTTVVLDLKLDQTDAKSSVEDLAGKQDNS